LALSLGRVLGALGNRVSQTKGLIAPRLFDLLLEKEETEDDLYYQMRPELRAVIDALPTLREAMALSVEEIHTKYANEVDWLTIDAA
jgi:hypothetical protein